MKNILIIGSSGFIGRKLSKKIAKKYNLICPKKRDGFDIKSESILKLFLNHKIDLVINLSGQISPSKKTMFDTILIGNKNIIKTLKKLKKDVSVYYFSSSLVYGYSRKIINENSKISPKNYYTLMKSLAEIEYTKSNINFKIFRLANIYDDKKNGIIKNLINHFSYKKKLVLTNINTFRNYIHIDDLVNIIDKTLKTKLSHNIYNIGNENYSILNIIKTLEKNLKYKAIFDNNKTNLKYLSSQKISRPRILKEIKYKPKVKLISFMIKKIKK